MTQSIPARFGVRKTGNWAGRQAVFGRSAEAAAGHHGRMRTIRLSDPFKHGKPAQQLEWGTSAWAADSCLAEWSTFEREWLGAPPPTKNEFRSSRWGEISTPLYVWLGLLLLGLGTAWATWG